MPRSQSPLDPYAADDTPRASITIDGADQPVVESYSYDSDVLNLGDPCSVVISNVGGRYKTGPEYGQAIQFYMEDPAVAGGAKTLKMTGIVTKSRAHAGTDGSRITITGADLGWHIVNNTAPLWSGVTGTLQQITERNLDPSWKFTGVDFGNDANRRNKLGKAGVVAAQNYKAGDVWPRFQVDTGQDVASFLVDVARKLGLLVNVSADGRLLFFRPNYDQEPLYRFEYHNEFEAAKVRNNVQSVDIEKNIADVYTDLTLVWEHVIQPPTSDAAHPNEGKGRARYKNRDALPFVRRTTFTDGSAYRQSFADKRVRYKFFRGLFGAFQYTVKVKGHSQNGYFFEPDTMAAVNDTVHGVVENLYVAAVSYSREMQGGTTTTITMHRPGLLLPDLEALS